MQPQIMDNFLLRRVSEFDMIDIDHTLRVDQNLGIRSIRNFRRLVQQPEHPFRRGRRGLQLGDDVGRFIDRAGELPRIHHK